MSSSGSEEFYDAEDNTPSHGTRKSARKESKDSLKRASSEPNVSNKEENSVKPTQKSVDQQDETVVPENKLPVGTGRRKFQEIRKKLQTDDEDCANPNLTPPNSQTSSIDGVSGAANKNSHPFKIIEQDTLSLQSLNSLGRVGRIGLLVNVPENNVEPSKKTPSVSALSSSSLDSESTTHSSRQFPSTLTISGPSTGTTQSVADEKRCPLPLQEPDVIASTKPSNVQKQFNVTALLPSSAPVAPPRRKKKNKTALQLTKSASSASTFETNDLASPASTIESLTRDFEHSLDRLPSLKSIKSLQSTANTFLDINQAVQGQFVVKPQDTESLKGQDFNKKSPDNLPIDVNEQKSSPRGSSTRSSVGHYSLGPHRGTHQSGNKNTSKERRKSAGDENFFKDLNLHVRTHTDSGKQLSDLEILEQVTVLNLDTGELIPLSVAEEKLPQCINPLSLHIMRLTSEYVSSSSMEKEKDTDEESVDIKKSEIPILDESELEPGRMRKKTAKIKRFLGTTVKKTMDKAKSLAHARHKDDTIDILDHVHPGEQNCKLKASNSHKGPYEFEKVEHVQELNDQQHEGPVWCMKFSVCGRLLATAGQDKVLRIWIVKDAYPFFQDMRTKYNAEKVSPTPSQESLVSHHSSSGETATFVAAFESLSTEEANKLTFMPKPFCTYTGHTSDLLDVSWSKNYFILSSSMDKTVRLWHISRKECLCCFQHIDFVTAIVFHPKDDRYFLSGSLDGKLRLWNIPDKKVAVWNEVETSPKLITAANFCQNGKFAVVGTYDGRCIFYSTDQLKYYTQIHVRSSRGRNATGRKISGIEPMPGEDKILVTSNDSRIRLYDLRDLNVSCKYKGYVNMSSQIKASFSHDGKFIISGSENRDIYIWKANHDYSKFSSVRRDRNDFWEAIKAHGAVVTCAIFAPHPEVIIKMWEDANGKEVKDKVEDPMVEQHAKGTGYVLVSADFNGCIKVFINKTKPKHSSLPVSAMA